MASLSNSLQLKAYCSKDEVSSEDKFGLITCEHSLGVQSMVDDCG